MPTPAGATCPEHSGSLAVDVCQRCGRFVCPVCLVLRGEVAWCSACAALPHGVSKRAWAALGFSLIGFVSCGLVIYAPVPLWLVTAGVAFVLGVVEQRAIVSGASSAAGLRIARWAVRLATLQLVLSALGVLAFVAWRLTRTP